MDQSDVIGLIKQYQTNPELFKSNPNNMRNVSSSVSGGAYGTLPGFEGRNGGYTQYNPDGTTTEVPSNMPEPGMFDGVTIGGIAQGLGAAAGLANAYMGYKNYGLSKDKFAFEKAATNRSIANQASEYNTGVQNAGEVGMGLAGNTMDANARTARQAQLDAQKISGLAIG